MTIYDILKDTAYKTEQFTAMAIDNLNSRIIEKEDKNGKNTQWYSALFVKEKKYVLI